MNKIIFNFSILFFLSYLCFGQEHKQVLFLGNSYTAVNNLPEMVEMMAASTNDILEYDSNTPGGFRFMNHANSETSLQKIQDQNWDFVVLQGQSQETAFPPSQLESEIYPYAEILINKIRENDSCSIPLFYMTWGRKNGDPVNCPYASWFCTYEEMDDAIRETYLYMTEENNAQVSPVGAVWRYIRENNEEIELYASDESHPSLEGSYAAAASFYTMIFKKDPTEISWDAALDPEITEKIKLATKTVVYDAMDNWIYSLSPEADFTEEINELEVQFNNLSENFDSLVWDFGDGNFSTEMDPIHIYEEEGDYEVSLNVYLCEAFQTFTKTLSVSHEMGLDSYPQNHIQIYPNPTSQFLYIKLHETNQKHQVQILDLNGRILKKLDSNESEIRLDLSHLNVGLYFVNIKNGIKEHIEKIIINQ